MEGNSMRIKDILVVKRAGGFFEYEDRKIPAVHAGNGYGVGLKLESSQVDVDFGFPILFLTNDDVSAIKKAFLKSDKQTFQLIGHGWKNRSKSKPGRSKSA
jgi:hypothetical protein